MVSPARIACTRLYEFVYGLAHLRAPVEVVLMEDARLGGGEEVCLGGEAIREALKRTCTAGRRQGSVRGDTTVRRSQFTPGFAA